MVRRVARMVGIRKDPHPATCTCADCARHRAALGNRWRLTSQQWAEIGNIQKPEASVLGAIAAIVVGIAFIIGFAWLVSRIPSG